MNAPDALTAPPAPALVRFHFRGRPVCVDTTATPTRSVLQWLREDAHACGTKEGCAEGDCGACTVLVAELDDDPAPPAHHPALPGPVRADGLVLRPVNACIRFLPTLHGKALLTVEDLAGPGGALHPAQQALVTHHGSQCGFCTPGFAMTLAAVHEHHRRHGTQPDRPALADALAGNLCRCTGYRPILDAGQAMADLPGPALPLAGVADILRQWRDAPPPAAPAPSIVAGAPTAGWHAPRTLAELAALRLGRPEARLLAGGTDIGLWVTKQFRDLGEIIWLGEVAELRRMNPTPTGGLRIGAAVPLQDAWGALAARWPALTDLARRFAGPPVRHAGTLCGNLANGSPIGDAAPALMALGASLTLRRGDAVRELPLDRFYLDYLKNALQPGEFVEAVTVPAADPAWVLQVHKVSKRFDCDISALSAGLALRLDTTVPGVPVVADVRLAFGGLAATVRRAARAEAALRGLPWDEVRVRAAQAALAQDFQPLSDLRASAGYRQRSAAALLQRLWLAHRPDQPLPASALDVNHPAHHGAAA